LLDFNNPEDVKMHDEVVSLVERMMILKKRYNDITDEKVRQQLDHAIKATDEQIDQLVYKLYNLTEEEIAVVEGGNLK
jgi:predicted  nucleic acid-binding Zn-ribbon protein